MPAMQIAAVQVGGGTLGLCPLPGRGGDYAADFAALRAFDPAAVLSLVQVHEYARHGAPALTADLAAAGIAQIAFPIRDFGTPVRQTWPALSHSLHAFLTNGRRVLIHCLGGCGRSGTIALRLMIEFGEPPDTALLRLRQARPCAVETKAQLRWALGEPPQNSSKSRSRYPRSASERP